MPEKFYKLNLEIGSPKKNASVEKIKLAFFMFSGDEGFV
jgi:hypothetical protein